VPADELVGAALTRLEDALGDHAVEVDVQPELLLWIDPVLFEQVLINLLENALKHAKPPFWVGVRRQGDRVAIEIGDRGPGLPAPATRLFEKFVRASSAPGVGLGLAVVRAIVTAHGGTVTASDRPGGGSLFHVEIPAGSPPPRVTLPEAA
jgi:two-component system, OmpR family, sensor histidine kinase KdpD